MLSYAENKRVVDRQPGALRLGDVEVVPLCMWRWVAKKEVVWWILTNMRERQCQSHGMWVVFDRVHQATFASIYFENSLTFVSRKQSFDREAFTTSDPLCLRESSLFDDIAAFEEVTIRILGESSGFSLSNTLYIFGYIDVEMRHLQVLQVLNARIEVGEFQTIAEVCWAGARESNQNLMRELRHNVLLLWQQRNMGIAQLERPGQEVPRICYLATRGAVRASSWMCWPCQCAVEQAPLTIYDNSIPVMVRPSDGLDVKQFARTFEVATNNFGMYTDSIAHIGNK